MSNALSHLILFGLPCPADPAEAEALSFAWATKAQLSVCVLCNAPVADGPVAVGVFARPYGTAVCLAHGACSVAPDAEARSLARLDAFADKALATIEAANGEGETKH